MIQKESNQQSFLDDLIHQAKQQQDSFDATTVRCGLIGLSGSGKSSLINAIAGQKIAPVGSTEQTMQAQSYMHQGIEFVDLPGCGTATWPQASYIADLQLLDYDCFIVVTHNRLYEADLFLLDELAGKQGKPCFVVRNKIDQAIHDEWHDNQLDEQQVLHKVRLNLQQHIGSLQRVYLTSARFPAKWDLPALITDIATSQQGFKRDRFIAGMAAWSAQAMAEKRKVALKIVSWSAVMAAANGLNPIPLLNLSVDTSVLTSMCDKLNQLYGLSAAQLAYAEKASPHLQHSAEFTALKVRIGQWIARYSISEGIVFALKQLGKAAMVKNISHFLPFVGNLVAAGLGYRLTVAFGEQYIGEAEALARQLLDEVIQHSDTPTSPA